MKARSYEEKAKALRAKADAALTAELGLLDRLETELKGAQPEAQHDKGEESEGRSETEVAQPATVDRPHLIEAVREVVNGMEGDFTVKDIKQRALAKYPALDSTHMSSWPKAVATLRDNNEVVVIEEAKGKRGATYRVGSSTTMKFAPEAGAR